VGGCPVAGGAGVRGIKPPTPSGKSALVFAAPPGLERSLAAGGRRVRVLGSSPGGPGYSREAVRGSRFAEALGNLRGDGARVESDRRADRKQRQRIGSDDMAIQRRRMPETAGLIAAMATWAGRPPRRRQRPVCNYQMAQLGTGALALSDFVCHGSAPGRFKCLTANIGRRAEKPTLKNEKRARLAILHNTQ
jgi:hypothetical protein